MQHCDREFYKRAARIPLHGVGLSVDVFSPRLLDLDSALEQAGLRPDYWEVFEAPSAELARIRRALAPTPCAYHAEGVWLIDPELVSHFPWVEQTRRMARHAENLGAAWINHECASKQFAGYSFGTYLPPLFTRAAAEVAAANAVRCQRVLDQCFESTALRPPPLLLLELPPLTYFSFGDLAPAEFFSEIAQAAPCGFVLDIGHLWTIWRYGQQTRVSLESFTDTFLEAFPLHRVIQLHLAGLASAYPANKSDDSLWIDAHGAPVPQVLWRLLDRVLAHRGLTSLKGVALEVDTKAVPLIVEEFGELRARSATVDLRTGSASKPPPLHAHPIPPGGTGGLAELYGTYARIVSGQQTVEKSLLEPLSQNLNREGLHQYVRDYLPNELLHWGGDLEDLFPQVSRTLKERGISHQEFVRFWFRQPYPAQDAYDFFDIKLDRWMEFVRTVAPDLAEETEREVTVLQGLHAELNHGAVPSSPRSWETS
ncbi:MAG: DUF692 family multinuclear iron-containing protein [Nitrospirota bacterium]